MKYVQMFYLVPVLVQFILANSQITLLLVVLSGLSEGRRRSVFTDSRVVDDLPGSPVARHSSLRCSPVCAHLQADDIFAFSQLLL